MKKYLNKFLVTTVMTGLLGLTACENFLDVNVDPNNPTSSSADVILPSGLGSVAYSLGNQYQFLGNVWAQHWTQSFVAGQYKELDRYRVSAADYDRPWLNLYATALSDFKYISDNAGADSSNYAAIADIMTAYTYQLLVDAHDQVPFTEALQGAANLTPAYDAGDFIYTELIPIIDRGISKINTTAGARPGNEDMIYQGNMNLWRKFANTLKLRIYLRQVYARPGVAAAGIQQLYANGAEFLGANEGAYFNFQNATNKANPAYQTEMVFSQGVNLIASSTIIDTLKSYNDPRIDDFFNKATTGANAGQHMGTPQGSAGLPNAPAPPITNFSRPSAKVLGAVTPVPFISGAESLFLQAEAASRGLSSQNAALLYEQGIAASFAFLGRSGAEAAAYSALPKISLAGISDPEERLDRIITQKWISMNGTQGFEAWTEHRRTGYPSFIAPSLSSTLAAGRFPNRLPFVETEQTRNPKTPGLVDIFVPVWWDKKN